MVNTFRERKHISLTLNDTKSALNKVHQLFNLIAGAITFSLRLVILNIVNFKIFVVIGTQLLVGVFMFGNTLKITFESIIFLFVRHQYDVGDRCDINGVQMVVEEMNTLTTNFLTSNYQKVSFPTLATLSIGNYFRSPDIGDSIDFSIHVSTPVQKIANLKRRLVSEEKKNCTSTSNPLIRAAGNTCCFYDT